MTDNTDDENKINHQNKILLLMPYSLWSCQERKVLPLSLLLTQGDYLPAEEDTMEFYFPFLTINLEINNMTIYVIVEPAIPDTI